LLTIGQRHKFIKRSNSDSHIPVPDKYVLNYGASMARESNKRKSPIGCVP
jgi:hypothetical protein